MDRGNRDRISRQRDDTIKYRQRPIADISNRYRKKSTQPSMGQKPIAAAHVKYPPNNNPNNYKNIGDITVTTAAAANLVRKHNVNGLGLDINRSKHANSGELIKQPSAHKVYLNTASLSPRRPAVSGPIKHYRQMDMAQAKPLVRHAQKMPAKGNMPAVPELPIPKQKRIKKIAHNIKHLFAKKKRGYALSVVAVLLLIFGVAINLHSFMVTKKIEAQATASAQSDDNTTGEERPSTDLGYTEDRPTSKVVSQYKVAADLPKYLKISDLGIFSRVIRVGTSSQTGEIGTPRNVFDTAWYEGSAKPGEKGAVFIDGHVSGSTKGGIFVNLKNIKVGARITIVKGDNSEIDYRVASIEKYDADKVDMIKALMPYDPKKEGLNIMTCNGKYINDTKTFDKRLVVYTVRE